MEKKLLSLQGSSGVIWAIATRIFVSFDDKAKYLEGGRRQIQGWQSSNGGPQGGGRLGKDLTRLDPLRRLLLHQHVFEKVRFGFIVTRMSVPVVALYSSF